MQISLNVMHFPSYHYLNNHTEINFENVKLILLPDTSGNKEEEFLQLKKKIPLN